MVMELVKTLKLELVVEEDQLNLLLVKLQIQIQALSLILQV